MVSILLSGAGGKMGQVITRSVSERDDCRIAPASTFTPSTAAIRFSPLRSSVILPAMSSSIFLILRLPIPCSIMQ